MPNTSKSLFTSWEQKHCMNEMGEDLRIRKRMTTLLALKARLCCNFTEARQSFGGETRKLPMAARHRRNVQSLGRSKISEETDF